MNHVYTFTTEERELLRIALRSHAARCSDIIGSLEAVAERRPINHANTLRAIRGELYDTNELAARLHQQI